MYAEDSIKIHFNLALGNMHFMSQTKVGRISYYETCKIEKLNKNGEAITELETGFTVIWENVSNATARSELPSGN